MKKHSSKTSMSFDRLRPSLTKPRLCGLLVSALLLLASLSVWAQYAPPPAGLVAWWRAEGNANDSADSHNGALQGGMGFTNGVFGQAFATGSNKRVYVPDST